MAKKKKPTILPEGINRDELARVPVPVIIYCIITRTTGSLVDLCSKSRNRNILESQQLLCYFVSVKNWAWRYTGDLIGKDHATAMYHKRMIENRIFTEKSYDLFVHDLAINMILLNNRKSNHE